MAQAAQAVTCTSNNDGNWNGGSNVWSGCTLTNNAPPAGATVIISNNTVVQVNSSTSAAVASVTINSGGELQFNNSATLSMTGNLTNNGTFTQDSNNTGTLAFTGTSAQTITGISTFYKMSVGTSTSLKLTSNVTVSSTMTGTPVFASTCPVYYSFKYNNGGTTLYSCVPSCSTYKGLATINEVRIGVSGSSSASNQIEIYNSTSLATTVWKTWKLVVNYKSSSTGTPTVYTYPLSTGFINNGKFIYNSTTAIYLRNRSGRYIDIALTDSAGNFIDYIAIGGTTAKMQATSSCLAPTTAVASTTSGSNTTGDLPRATDGGLWPASVATTSSHTIGLSNVCSSGSQLILTNTVDIANPILNTTGVTYTLIVSNNSCNNAINGVTVTDTNIVSTKFTGLTYTPTTGTTAQSGTNRVWTVGNLAAGTSATLTITGTPNTLGILATAATATATTTGLASTSVLSATASINTRDFNYVGFILPTDTVTEGTDLSYAAEIDSNLLASSPITINYTVTGTGAGASDITVTSAGSVTINPSSVDFPQNTSINFNIIDDSVYEITKAITLTITSVTSNDASVKLDPATSSITITLLDNDMPTLVAEYQFDEASWTGATAEVQDTSGHGFNGKAKGVSGLPITQNTTPAIATDPGTCTYGKFGGASTGQHVNFGATNLGLGGAVGLSVTAWVRWGVDPATGNQWSNVISNGNSGSGQFWIQHSQLNNHFEFAVKTSVTRNYVWSKTTPVMGQWYHVAGVYDGAALHMYVNGVLDDYSTVALTGTVTPYVSTYFFNIGIDNSYVRSFQGDIDEVKIFSGGLSDSQVADLYAEVHPCPVIPAPHHIEVSHASGTGATCAPSALTLRACSDAACTALYTAGVTGTMSATGTPTVNWDGSTGGATGAGFVIAAGSSSVTKNVQVTTVGTTVIGTTLVTPTPLGTSPVCTFGTPTCTFTATSAGAFTVSVPSHRSCTLQAPTITLPAACASTLTGSKSVGLKFAYVSPSTPATPTAHVPYAGLASPGSALATAANVAVNLTFAGGVASLPYFVYDDAGSLTLSASYTGSGVDAGLSITGTSPAFVVAPNSFTLSGVDASLVAGKPFNTTVTAMNACTTPAATPNFTGTVVLSSGNPLPAQGNATAISQSLASFSAGVASTSLTWGEVGSIDLTASLSNYLLSGISVTGSKTAVGSFKPAYFDTTVIKACNTFTYSGQPFTTKVTARALGGTTTANYAGATYARAVALSASGSLAGAFTNAAITAASFAAGEATASPTFTFSTNPSGRATLAVHAVDTDGVTSTVAAVGPPAVAGTEGSTDLLSGRIRLQNAFGSEKLALTLPIQAQYYDSTSAAFKLNTEDSCTALTWPAVQTLAGTASPGPAAGVYFYPVVTNKNQITSTDTTRTPSGSVPIAAGKANLQFSAPQKRGWVDVIMTVPDYLLGNWGNCLNQGSDTLLNDMPCARATFGVFGAKSPIIYRRENY